MSRNNVPVLDPTVGLLSAHLPRELFYAFGCMPVRVFPSAGKPTAAEAFLPRNFCSLSRLILASYIENGATNLDAVVFSDEDDATRRLHDVWRESVPVPVWAFVDVPRDATSLGVNRYTEILTHLAADLGRYTGRVLEASALRQAITLYNEQRVLLADLKRHWLSGLLNTITYRRLRQTALTRNPIVANALLGETLKDTKDVEPGQDLPPPDNRLLLLAELAAPSGLVRLIEARNVRMVAEDSDLDERDLAEPVPADAQTVDGLLAALARAYLAKPPGPRMRDMRRRLAYLSRLIDERDVQAAIFAYNKFCDLYLAEFPTLKAHLDGLGVPVLLLELEDENLGGQQRTRVEAFLEMLNRG